MRLLRCLPVALAFCAQSAMAQVSADMCGELANGYGPFDYRSASADKKHIVESYHFTQDIELLRRDPGDVAANLNYTLRAFPNHPRALRAMDMLGRRLKTEEPPRARLKVECWFERAVRFQKDDGMVRMLYGVYLVARNRKQEGLTQLQAAESMGKGGANLHYNLGLAYFDLGQHEKALEHAKEAYALGFPLGGLRDKLKRAGKWR